MNQKLIKLLRNLHHSITLPNEELNLDLGCGFVRVGELENGDCWAAYYDNDMEENLVAYFQCLSDVFKNEDFSVRFSYFYYSTCFFMVTGMHMFSIPEKLLTERGLMEKVKEQEARRKRKVPSHDPNALIAAIFALPYVEGRPVMFSEDIPVKNEDSLLQTYNSIKEYDAIVKNLCESIGHPEEFPLYQEFLRCILTSFLFEDESEPLLEAIEAHLPHLYMVILMQREDYIWQQIQYEQSPRGQTEEALAWNDFVVKISKDETFYLYIQNLYVKLLKMEEESLSLTCCFGKSDLEKEFSVPLYRHFFNSKHLEKVSALCAKKMEKENKSEILHRFIEKRWNSSLSPRNVKNNQCNPPTTTRPTKNTTLCKMHKVW